MMCGFLGAIPLTAVVVGCSGGHWRKKGEPKLSRHHAWSFLLLAIYHSFRDKQNPLCFPRCNFVGNWIQSYTSNIIQAYVAIELETILTLYIYDRDNSYDGLTDWGPRYGLLISLYFIIQKRKSFFKLSFGSLKM